MIIQGSHWLIQTTPYNFSSSQAGERLARKRKYDPASLPSVFPGPALYFHSPAYDLERRHSPGSERDTQQEHQEHHSPQTLLFENGLWKPADGGARPSGRYLGFPGGAQRPTIDNSYRNIIRKHTKIRKDRWYKYRKL